jgi:hypothetical protein
LQFFDPKYFKTITNFKQALREIKQNVFSLGKVLKKGNWIIFRHNFLLKKFQVLVTCYYLGTWGNTWVLVQVLGFDQNPKYLTSLVSKSFQCLKWGMNYKIFTNLLVSDPFCSIEKLPGV